MTEQSINVNGWLVAEVEPDEWRASGSSAYGGRLFLFRSVKDWTLLRVRHATDFDAEGRPEGGRGSVFTTTYADLEALKSDLERCGRSADWRDLVKAGAANYDRDLMVLWTPVQIDRLLDARIARGPT